ncbi:MAG: alpha/beta hydrolase [Fidelibacterota bacterium]|nr:MAG: alpha/beta hydrolase [Candidatus Neomarinimicrobiota bacterium]
MQSCTVEPADAHITNNRGETVILLHGLLRTGRSMDRMERSLISHGYQVVNVSYPSRELPIERLAEDYLANVVSTCCATSDSNINFVTHSIGGIVLRYYLKHHDLARLGRVVMLSPPNQGTGLVDRMKDDPFFKALNGPAGLQMGTGLDSLPLKLGAVDFQVGVIAGTRAINPILASMIPQPNDGVIPVERTKVEGMDDFITAPSSHTFIMMNKDVIAQVVHFLQHGNFQKEASADQVSLL